MLIENLKQVKEHWKQSNLNLAEPLLEKELVDIFANIEIPISREVIEVYSNLNGFNEWEMDSECLTFWEIQKILKENKRKSEYVYFADFLINSHFYAFKFEDANNSSVFASYSENDNRRVADSFDEFFEIYLKNPAKLFV